MAPGELGDVDQAVDAAQINECTEVNDGGNGALQAHALRELLEDFSTLVLATLFEENTTGKNNVVAVAIHLDNTSFDFGAEVCSKILNTTKINERSRQEATETDVEDQAALDDFDNLAGNNFASLELFLNLNPSTLVLSTLLGEDETTVLVLLLENQGLELIAQRYDLRGISILADRKLAGRNNALALESDVNEYLVMLDLYNSAVDQIALVEVGQSAIDHLVHLFVRDVLKINDGRVLDFGQNGPLSKKYRGPFVRVCSQNINHVCRACRTSTNNKHVSGAYNFLSAFLQTLKV